MLPAPREKKPPNYKKALWLFAASMLSVLVYFGTIEISDAIWVYIPIIEIYTALMAVTVCAIFIVNAGLSDAPPAENELPDKWSAEKKEKFIGSFAKRKAAVKKLSFLLITLIVPVFMDVAVIWFEGLFTK